MSSENTSFGANLQIVKVYTPEIRSNEAVYKRDVHLTKPDGSVTCLKATVILPGTNHEVNRINNAFKFVLEGIVKQNLPDELLLDHPDVPLHYQVTRSEVKSPSEHRSSDIAQNCLPKNEFNALFDNLTHLVNAPDQDKFQRLKDSVPHMQLIKESQTLKLLFLQVEQKLSVPNSKSSVSNKGTDKPQEAAKEKPAEGVAVEGKKDNKDIKGDDKPQDTAKQKSAGGGIVEFGRMIKRQFMSLPHREEYSKLQKEFTKDDSYKRSMTNADEHCQALKETLDKSKHCFRLNNTQAKSFAGSFGNVLSYDFKNLNYTNNLMIESRKSTINRLLEKLQTSGHLSQKDVEDLSSALSDMYDLININKYFDSTDKLMSPKNLKATDKMLENLRSNQHLTVHEREEIDAYVKSTISTSFKELKSKIGDVKSKESDIVKQERAILSQLKIERKKDNNKAKINELEGKLIAVRQDRPKDINLQDMRNLLKGVINYNKANPKETPIGYDMKEWESLKREVGDIKTSNLKRRLDYDKERAELQFTDKEAVTKLEKARVSANKQEELSSKTHNVDFEHAKSSTVWKHSSASGSTPDSSETRTFSSGMVAGCVSKTNFKGEAKGPKTNEDSFCMQELTFSVQGKPMKINLNGVFDGHGDKGHLGSQFVRDNLPLFIQNELSNLSAPLKNHEIISAIRQAFYECNMKMLHDYPESSFGSTAVISFEFNGGLWTASVGDARAVLVRRDGTVIALSKDSSADDKDAAKAVLKREGRIEAGRLVEGGKLATPAAFGDFPVKGVKVVPRVTFIPFSDYDPEDKVILAGDGLWDAGSTEEAGKVVNQMVDMEPEKMADALANRARNATQKKEKVSGEDVDTARSNELYKGIQQKYFGNVRDLNDLKTFYETRTKKDLGTSPTNQDYLALISAIERGTKEHMPWAIDEKGELNQDVKAYFDELRKQHPIEVPFHKKIVAQFQSWFSRVKGPTNQDDITVMVVSGLQRRT